ncbi:MAG: hypothetical protein WBZ36_09470 [Candidatus Nitrosopolaris sp.]
MIAKTVPSVYRIGIDFETLKYLEIDPRIEETYNPKQNYLKIGPTKRRIVCQLKKWTMYITNESRSIV